MRNKVDVAIIDIDMPGLSGDKLVDVLRQNKKLDTLSIIIVSGTSEQKLDDLNKRIDIQGVLSKRDIKSKLIRTIERANALNPSN